MSTDTREWRHLILTTYGAWLYGDARGFRTRHHREHIEGDYKNPPPPDLHADREHRSRESLKQLAVCLPVPMRRIVGEALQERLEELGALVVCIAVANQHIHVLLKLPPKQLRHWSGLAKQHAWFVARDKGWQGKLWAKRCQAVKIRDRRHQLNVYRYILRHAEQGAWVWKWTSRGAG